MKEYHAISEETIDRFRSVLQSYTDNGYQPIGGIACVVLESGRKLYTQMMRRVPSEKKDCLPAPRAFLHGIIRRLENTGENLASCSDTKTNPPSTKTIVSIAATRIKEVAADLLERAKAYRSPDDKDPLAPANPYPRAGLHIDDLTLLRTVLQEQPQCRDCAHIKNRGNCHGCGANVRYLNAVERLDVEIEGLKEVQPMADELWQFQSALISTLEAVKHAINNLHAYDAEALGDLVDRVDHDLQKLRHGNE